MCAYARVFRKQPGCVPIGACALIKTNMVFLKLFFNGQWSLWTYADSFLNGLYARALKCHGIRMPCEKIVDMYIFLSVNITLC